MKDLFGNKVEVSWSKYIKSPEWKRRADAKRRGAGHRCEYCNLAAKVLEVHHLTYERLGYEEDDDLVVLCKACHAVADTMRRREIRRVRDLRAYERGVETYASKKYGDDWYSIDPYEIYEEYDEWIRDQIY